MKRISGRRAVAAEGRSGSLLALERSGRHLPAGHAVEGVVHENAPELLASAGGLKSVIEADRPQVAVALVGDGHGIGTGAANAGRRSAGAAVRGGNVRGIPVIIRKHAAPDRVDEYSLVLKPQFGTRLGDQLVDYAMSASRTVMGEAYILAAAGKAAVHPPLFDCLH